MSEDEPHCKEAAMNEIALREKLDGTGAGLLEFLDWAAGRGELTPSTARSTAVSARQVLSIDGDPAAINILEADPEDLFDRFETLNRTKYTTKSLTVYRSRFMNAVAMYRAWLEKKPDWKTAGGWGRRTNRASGKATRDGGTTRRRNNASSPSKAVEPTGQPAIAPAAPTSTSQMNGPLTPETQASTMVPYDLPLRPGLRARLVLPEMLTRADADRIAAFVNSLAFDQVTDAEAKEGGT
jgi:hypothetical protein